MCVVLWQPAELAVVYTHRYGIGCCFGGRVWATGCAPLLSTGAPCPTPICCHRIGESIAACVCVLESQRRPLGDRCAATVPTENTANKGQGPQQISQQVPADTVQCRRFVRFLKCLTAIAPSGKHPRRQYQRGPGRQCDVVAVAVVVPTVFFHSCAERNEIKDPVHETRPSASTIEAGRAVAGRRLLR